MSTFDFGDLAPWFGGGKGAAEDAAPAFDAWKPQRDAFDGFLAAKTKAFDAFEGGDVFDGDGTHDALDQARALLPDQPALRDAFDRDVGRLRESFAPAAPAPAEPAPGRPLEDLLARYAAIPARAPDQAAWVQRRADRLVGTAERLNLVDTKTADALMNRFGADASEHLALGTARRGGAKPVLDALADRALFPDLKGGRRKRLRNRLQARLLGEADDRALGQERAGSKERRDKLAAAYARAAELAALADRPAAEIEDAAAAAAITPGLRRLLRGLIERNRAEARREAAGIARVEAALDTGTPLDRDDPEERAAADAHYEAVAPVWRGLEPKARLALILPYVRSLGLLPKGLVRRLDAALRGAPQDKHAAAGLIGAIARDAPAALADLRPGAVVQAAAINALSELGYSPERAVERATEIIAGRAEKPDLNGADDAEAVARSVATAATQAPQIILANSGFFGELRRRLFGDPAETPSPWPNRAELERWQRRLPELAEPSTPEQRGDLAETFARIADGRLDVDELPRDQDGRVRIGRYALDPRVAEYVQEILRTPPEGLRALAREIQTGDLPPAIRMRLQMMIADRLNGRSPFGREDSDEAARHVDRDIRLLDDDLTATERMIVDGIGERFGGRGGTGRRGGPGSRQGSTTGPGIPSVPPGTTTGPPRLHVGKQGKHQPGHNNFDPARGRSVLTHPNPQQLLNRFAGRGQQVNNIPTGQPGSRERVDFGEVIGLYHEGQNPPVPTTVGMIHYDAAGRAHIVPIRPRVTP